MTKKEPGLIVAFDENNSDYETQKFEIERFFRFLLKLQKKIL